MRKFWNWKEETENTERTLFLNGVIAENSWFDDEVTPKLFKDELSKCSGDITVWIDSPGGCCFAAAQIYNMLKEYNGKVTVKVDGLAASAASVIAMAGDEVLMSPVSVMMIHNPLTWAWGDHTDLKKAIDMLNEVKESIINAYVLKTGQSRAKLSHLMDSETYMNANKAIELGFADGIMFDEKAENNSTATMFSQKAINNMIFNKISAKCRQADTEPAKKIENLKNERSVDYIMERLNNIKKHI